MSLATLLQRPGLQQFIKFCIIGTSSLALDVLVSSTLIYGLNMNPTAAKAISFLFGVTNGFVWNSLWTFRGMGSGRRHEMYVKFVAVNVVGFIFNILLFKSVLFLFTGRFIGQTKPDKFHFLIATGVAAFCVAFWNFTANRKWTFSEPRLDPAM